MHPYFVSKSVINDDFGGWNLDPVFTSKVMQDFVGGKKIPYFDKPLAYTVTSFDENGNWIFHKPSDTLKIETPEDYTKALGNEILWMTGQYDDKKSAAENANSENHKKTMKTTREDYDSLSNRRKKRVAKKMIPT